MQSVRQFVLAAALLQWHMWSCLAAIIPSAPLITPAASHRVVNLEQRDDSAVADTSTCGYLSGDPSQPWTANEGFNCRTDPADGLWGFCTTTQLYAKDCSFRDSCVDEFDCKDGCGPEQNQAGTTTCSNKQQCTTAFLQFGAEQTYSYIGCGPVNTIWTYLATPTAAAKTTTTPDAKQAEQTDSSSATPSATTPSATAPSNSPSSATNSSDAKSDSENKSSGNKTNTTGPIIGGVLGGLALICVSVVAGIYLWRRNRSDRPPAYTPSIESTEGGAGKKKYRFKSTAQELPGSTTHAPRPQELQG